MKKAIAVLLCLMMLFSCAAMADSVAAEKEPMGTLNVDGAFDLKCAIPEGYTLDVITNENSSVIAMITSEEEGKPYIYLSIAYNDMYYGVERLNDLDEEATAAIADSFLEEDDVEISKMTTSYGTELFVIKEIRDEVDFVDFYTIYKGYEVELILTHVTADDSGAEEEKEEAAFVPVTDEEIRLAVQFLSDLDFVPAEADTPAK